MVIVHSYVSLPEGIAILFTVTSHICCLNPPVIYTLPALPPPRRPRCQDRSHRKGHHTAPAWVVESRSTWGFP